MKIQKKPGILDRIRLFLTPWKTKRAILRYEQDIQAAIMEQEHKDAFQAIVSAFPGKYDGLTLSQAVMNAAREYGVSEYKNAENEDSVPPFDGVGKESKLQKPRLAWSESKDGRDTHTAPVNYSIRRTFDVFRALKNGEQMGLYTSLDYAKGVCIRDYESN